MTTTFEAEYNAARRHRILSAEEERALFITIDEAKGSDDPQQLAAAKEARDTLTRLNIRLVYKIANSYARESAPDYDDLVQEGCIGMMHAIEKFEYRKDKRFSTYATWWIRQAMQRHQNELRNTIAIPVHVCEAEDVLKRETERLTMALGREPTTSEIETAWYRVPRTRTRTRNLDLVRATARATMSLDKPLRLRNQEEEMTLMDILPDRVSGDVSDQIIRREDQRMIRDAMRVLDQRERAIITMRHGIESGEPMTLNEIGRALNLTRERIRQIERDALIKLRSLLTAALNDDPRDRTPRAKKDTAKGRRITKNISVRNRLLAHEPITVALFQRCTAREQQIVTILHGLDTGTPVTARAVSEQLGIDQGTVWRTERAVLDKIARMEASA